VLLDEQYESSYYQGLMTAYQIMRGRVWEKAELLPSGEK
jgi:hypothetical protein